MVLFIYGSKKSASLSYIGIIVMRIGLIFWLVSPVLLIIDINIIISIIAVYITFDHKDA